MKIPIVSGILFFILLDGPSIVIVLLFKVLYLLFIITPVSAFVLVEDILSFVNEFFNVPI